MFINIGTDTMVIPVEMDIGALDQHGGQHSMHATAGKTRVLGIDSGGKAAFYGADEALVTHGTA